MQHEKHTVGGSAEWLPNTCQGENKPKGDTIVQTVTITMDIWGKSADVPNALKSPRTASLAVVSSQLKVMHRAAHHLLIT